jgi:hypothetical protein
MNFEWKNVTDDALIEEVRRRGFAIRDAQIEVNSKEWNEIQCQCGHKMFVKHTEREWVGLTDEEIDQFYADTVDEFQFYQAIEAKLKEKNI